MTTLSVPITFEGRSTAQILQAAELSQLVPGRFYWITDATLAEGLWVYAMSASAFRVLSPGGILVRDLHAKGYAFVCDQADGTMGGLIAADELEKKLWVIGTSKTVPTDYDDADQPVELAGSEITLHASSIGMLLANAAIGAPIEVAGISDGHAILRAGVVPVPDFEASDSDSGDFIIPSTDTWTTVGVDILSLGQLMPAGAVATYQVYGRNLGSSRGTLTVGFEYDDVIGNPGVWVPAATVIQHELAGYADGLLTSSFPTVSPIPLGANVRMRVKAVAEPTESSVGAFTFYGSSIAAVPAGGFRSNHQKPVSTTIFRISKTDVGDVDVGALLLDLQPGSAFHAYRAVGNTSYTLVGVADQGTAVDITVSGGAGNNSNWSGDVAFEGTLASGLFDARVLGSEYPQTLTLIVRGSGSSSIDALKLRGKDLHTSVANPGDGDILVFRIAGDSWVLEAKPAAGANPALPDLTDVEITAVTDNEPLAYNSASAKWTNQTPEELGLSRDTHNHAGVYEPVDSTILREVDVDDTPVDNVLTRPISSNWAFDHAALTQAHGISAFGVGLVAAADAAGARGVLSVDPAGTDNSPSIDQYDLAGRLIAGSGPYSGLGAADVGTEATPAAGHWALGWVGTALRKFDLGALPIPGDVLRQADVDDTPVDNVLTRPISSNWAFDHAALTQVHGISAFGSSLVATADAAGARSVLNVDPAGTDNSPNIDQYDLAGRLTAGNGTYAGLGSADLAEEASPGAGHKLVGWVSGALRRFDIGDLPAATGGYDTYDSFYLPAAAFAPRGTNPAEADTISYATNDVVSDCYRFDAITEEGIQLEMAMPLPWDLGVVKAKFLWEPDAGASVGDDIGLGIAIRAIGDGTTVDAAFPARTVVTDDVLNVGLRHETPATAAVTVSGTLTSGVPVLIEITRSLGLPQELAQDLLFFGVLIQFRRSAVPPVAW